MTTRAGSNIATIPASASRQEAAKYERCAEFGKALPKLRKRVEADLRKRRLGRDTVIAAVVRLLDVGRIRVGNEAYAQSEQELRRDHAAQPPRQGRGRTVKMRFKAKSGIERELSITDRNAQPDRRGACQDLPGQHLFQYLDERRRGPSGQLDRRQRLYPRGDRRGFHRQAFPHLERERDRLRADLRGGRGGRRPQRDAGAGRRGARQHARDQPQILCPSGARSTRSRRRRAAACLAMSPPDEISVERRARADRLPRQAGAKARKPEPA